MKKAVLFMIVTLLISTVCQAAQCPSDKPIRWTNDKCISCDEAGKKLNGAQSISMADMYRITRQIEKSCPKVFNELEKISKNDCHLKDKTGKCRDCADPKPFEMDLADIGNCEKICNSKGNKKRYRVGQYCLPKKCPVNAPIMDKDGKCHSCTSSKDNIKSVSGCLSCRARFVPTGWSEKGIQGLQCSIKTKHKSYNRREDRLFSQLISTSCPSNKPIVDSFGDCRACSEAEVIESIKGCDKCPDREIIKTSNKPFTYFYSCKLKKSAVKPTPSKKATTATTAKKVEKEEEKIPGISTGVIYQYDRDQNLLREYHTIRNNPDIDLVVKHYHQNGKIWQEIPFNNKRYNGVLKIYDKNGVITDAARFNNGVQEGELLKYHPNGQVWQKVPFSEGKANGEVSIYNDAGELIDTKIWKDGELVQ